MTKLKTIATLAIAAVLALALAGCGSGGNAPQDSASSQESSSDGSQLTQEEIQTAKNYMKSPEFEALDEAVRTDVDGAEELLAKNDADGLNSLFLEFDGKMKAFETVTEPPQCAELKSALLRLARAEGVIMLDYSLAASSRAMGNSAKAGEHLDEAKEYAEKAKDLAYEYGKALSPFVDGE